MKPQRSKAVTDWCLNHWLNYLWWFKQSLQSFCTAFILRGFWPTTYIAGSRTGYASHPACDTAPPADPPASATADRRSARPWTRHPNTESPPPAVTSLPLCSAAAGAGHTSTGTGSAGPPRVKPVQQTTRVLWVKEQQGQINPGRFLLGQLPYWGRVIG